VSLRYFNVYGPRASETGAYASVIARFISQKKKGESLTIVGQGTQTRDFVHVRDVARANLMAAESPDLGKGEVINIGTGVERSVLEIANLVGGAMVHKEPRIEPMRSVADITKAAALLVWQPEIDFNKALKELIEEKQ
jgi:UDP-glucose 4-epimerase